MEREKEQSVNKKSDNYKKWEKKWDECNVNGPYIKADGCDDGVQARQFAKLSYILSDYACCTGPQSPLFDSQAYSYGAFFQLIKTNHGAAVQEALKECGARNVGC